MNRYRRWFCFAPVIALALLCSVSACKTTTDNAQPTSTPIPQEPFERMGWRWEPRLVTENQAARVAVGPQRTVVFTSHNVDWGNGSTVTNEELGFGGPILDLVPDGEGWKLLAMSCRDCPQATVSLVNVDASGRPADAVLKGPISHDPYGRIYRTPEGEWAVLALDATGDATWHEIRGGHLLPGVVAAKAMSSATAAVGPNGAVVVTGRSQGRLAVAVRDAAGQDFKVSYLGRLTRSGDQLPPTAMGAGSDAAVLAPNTRDTANASLFLYRWRAGAWVAGKVGFSSNTISYAATQGEDGTGYLSAREAQQGEFYNLTDLTIVPTPIPDAGGSGPIDLAVDHDGVPHIAFWARGRVWVLTPAEGSGEGS